MRLPISWLKKLISQEEFLFMEYVNAGIRDQFLTNTVFTIPAEKTNIGAVSIWYSDGVYLAKLESFPDAENKTFENVGALRTWLVNEVLVIDIGRTTLKPK